MSKYSGVSDTFFIPLAARIYVSKRFPHYFYDEKSLSLEKDIDLVDINKKTIQYDFIASVARYTIFDSAIKKFINQHNEVNIINLGCGLDTTFFRINDERATFYEIDFPDVISKRQQIFGKHDKDVLLGYSILDCKWCDHVDKTKPTLLFASGVFQYMHAEDIKKFFDDIRIIFPNCEIMFDYTNSVGLKYTNKYVEKIGNDSAKMYFAIDDEKIFANGVNAEIVNFSVFFKGVRKQIKKGLTVYTKVAMFVCDRLKRACVLQLRLK